MTLEELISHTLFTVRMFLPPTAQAGTPNQQRTDSARKKRQPKARKAPPKSTAKEAEEELDFDIMIWPFCLVSTLPDLRSCWG